MCLIIFYYFLPQHYGGLIECGNLMDLLWIATIWIMSLLGSSFNNLIAYEISYSKDDIVFERHCNGHKSPPLQGPLNLLSKNILLLI